MRKQMDYNMAYHNLHEMIKEILLEDDMENLHSA